MKWNFEAKNTPRNIRRENTEMLYRFAETLNKKHCEELHTAGTQPSVMGGSAMQTRVLPNKFIKIIVGGPEGFNELVRSILMERAGVGPAVLDAYHCIIPGEDYFTRLAIEYERLDGTMQEFLEEHRSDHQLCVTELTAGIRVYERAVAAKLVPLDFHYGNLMYKKLGLDTMRWYLVDFGETIRLGSRNKPRNWTPHQAMRNLESLRGKL